MVCHRATMTVLHKYDHVVHVCIVLPLDRDYGAIMARCYEYAYDNVY